MRTRFPAPEARRSFPGSGISSIAGLLAALVLATSSEARNLYVSPKGNDSAAGTIETPYATIQFAATRSAPGDTVVLREGTYRLARQVVPNSGTSERARITYRSHPGESVLVHGGSGYLFTFTSKSYLTFKGLRFTTADTAVGAGMFYFEDTRHIRFEDNEFFGMPAERGAENTSVIRCMSSGWPDAQNLNNSDSCVFRNNLFRDNLSPAFRLYDTKGWIIENNTFLECAQAVGGKDEPYDLLVRRNHVVGGGLAFYFAMQGGGNGVTITENIVEKTNVGFLIGGLGTEGRKRRNVKVFNNTFLDVRTAVHGWSDTAFDSSIGFWNNIVHNRTAANIGAGEDVGARFVNLNKYQKVRTDSVEYVLDHNAWWMPANDRSRPFVDGGAGFASLSEWTKGRAPFDAHSLWADPLFRNADSGDLHLGPASPCKGKGRDGEDLGAYPRGDDGTVIGRLLASSSAVPRRPTRILPRLGPDSRVWRIDGRRLGNEAGHAPRVRLEAVPEPSP
jgi:hypothetical protein